MTIAIWIIAICEAIRIIQNGIQLFSLIRNREEYDKRGDEALKAFKDSIDYTDKLEEAKLKKEVEALERLLESKKAGKEHE